MGTAEFVTILVAALYSAQRPSLAKGCRPAWAPFRTVDHNANRPLLGTPLRIANGSKGR
jgi:hypothetical protein